MERSALKINRTEAGISEDRNSGSPSHQCEENLSKSQVCLSELSGSLQGLPPDFSVRRRHSFSVSQLLCLLLLSLLTHTLQSENYSRHHGVSLAPIQGHVSLSEENLRRDPSLNVHHHPALSWWRGHYEPSVHRATMPGHEQGSGRPERSYLHQEQLKGCYEQRNRQVFA
jgi:hypothetical protein